ncbi:GNAT family N-acetyltransferase [Pedobacter nototheniae]|uniref:GNAT family N-acetyltransferase n=1 Tax=Pedobacter nototheniae TaxID=2488994 RepID=UPI0029315719|nr:GNAT family N-acetyltransferase [Pedobacter nototheniae]
MEITVRQAQEKEIDTLLEFEKGIVAAERPYDSTLKPGEIHYYDLLELIKLSEAEVLVAEINGEVVGSGYAKILTAKPYLKHTQFAYLGFMYVKPEFRGNGINKVILNALLNWAKEKGISEIRLEVYEENIAAKKAYAKAGFTPNLLEMRMEI